MSRHLIRYPIEVPLGGTQMNLPTSLKQGIPELQFGDSHIITVCRDYFTDQRFVETNKGISTFGRSITCLIPPTTTGALLSPTY